MRRIPRAKHLIALCVALVVAGALFFALHGRDVEEITVRDEVGEHVAAAPVATKGERRRVIEGPDPAAFRTFTRGSEQHVYTIDGACVDEYAAVMIYAHGVDYRESPLDAIYNIAQPCPASGVYERTIDLDAYPIRLGASYYVIRADQGPHGAWYNPR